jgi:hypothetical protein
MSDSLAGKAKVPIRKGQLNAQHSNLPTPPTGLASSGVAVNPPAKQPNTYTTKSSATAKDQTSIQVPLIVVGVALVVAIVLIILAVRK